jgi:S1-C subfamily serine protease
LKLADRPAEGKKVKCSKCSAAFVASDNEVAAASTSVKADPDFRPASTNRKKRDLDDEDQPNSVAKKKAGGAGLIIGICVGAFLLLGCLVTVPVVGFFFLRVVPAQPPMKVADVNKMPPDEAVGPIAKMPVEKIVPANPPINPKDMPVDLDKVLLDKTSRATALVRVDLGNQASSGSGFLVKSSGDTGYIITNFHVIAMERDEPQPAPNQGGKGKGGPKGFEGKEKFPFKKGPGGAFGKGGPFGAPAKEIKARVRVTVVLNSGTPEEQSLAAEIVSVDEESDLAALRVTGARNLPEAIDVNHEAAVAETLPVYIFGFPANKIPAKPGNPIITVGKGTIAGLRRDPNNELTDVHINGEINPGNSGGPVVDTKGRLVGIAVATVPGKQIGFVIPAGELNQMFKGRLSMGAVLQIRQGTRIDGET